MAIGILGLAAWLSAGLGLRAWLGGKAYLRALLGSEALADEAFARAAAMPETSLLLGMDPWTLLLAFSVSVSAALVLVLLWPWDLLLSRLRVSVPLRMVAAAGVAAAATGMALWSVHPLLSRPDVPEGPRTVLNYACEAAGYGWVNAIAYVGAIATGLGFVWLGARSGAEASESASESEAVDSGEGSVAAVGSDEAVTD
ncbi:MAG: hypothetical protein AB1Z98_33590 [Nannocystaceae bacterium]